MDPITAMGIAHTVDLPKNEKRLIIYGQNFRALVIVFAWRKNGCNNNVYPQISRPLIVVFSMAINKSNTLIYFCHNLYEKFLM